MSRPKNSPSCWTKAHAPSSPPLGANETHDDALVYDPTRWEIESDGGELVITNLVDRITPCDRLRTGRRGEVLEPGRLTAF